MSYEENIKAPVLPPEKPKDELRDESASAKAEAAYEKAMDDYQLTDADRKIMFKTIKEITAVGLQNLKAEIVNRGEVHYLKSMSGMLRVGYDRARDELYLIGFDHPRDEKMAKIIGEAVGIRKLRGRVVKRQGF